MRRTIMSIILVMFFASLLVLGEVSRGGGEGGSAGIVSNAQAQEGCTTASVQGTYGFSADGTWVTALTPELPAGPYAAGGVFTVDGAGNVSVTAPQSFSGTILPASPIPGTYAVNPDCTGSAVFTTGTTWNFVVADNGNEIRFISTTPGTVITGVAKKAAEGCTTASVQGRYGYTSDGLVFLPDGTRVDFAAGGTFTLDAEGNVSGVDTASFNGMIVPRTYMATAGVNSDCTGSATITFPDGDVAHVNLVFVDNGKEVLLFETDPGTAITLAAKKQ